MNKLVLMTALCLMAAPLLGQRIADFELMDVVSGKGFSLEQHRDSKAIVIVFSSVGCPFSKLYEDRVLELQKKFSAESVAFAFINPHTGQGEDESTTKMGQRAREKGYTLPFLADPDQSVTKMMGVSKIPEAVVLTSGPTGYAVAYKGAIDNNAQSAESASVHYLDAAIQNILNRRRPSPTTTRAVGCNIRFH
ncbi:redoxin domain-containing protein [Negadavirga shengliensis]|uniref:Redoxin domain-containing protein n=1 Tax=Negadavirga shengliensis TaxID=1389218 RepID=A0ABV9T8T5_9BACT